MLISQPVPLPFFTSLGISSDNFDIPVDFSLLVTAPHPLCLLAATDLQNYLNTQVEWRHNFGLDTGNEGPVTGKMFGVLVVRTQENEIGYLAAFSGKLAGSNDHQRFVPPVFDALTENSFLNIGMAELTRISQKIEQLNAEKREGYAKQVNILKKVRKKHSNALQKQLFDSYHFLNREGEEKSLTAIFNDASYKNPPAGAGECAGPKLLQYAFRQKMTPLAMAEFWWGLSPKSNFWKHGNFYACCTEKCEPILVHMLSKTD